MKQMLKTIISIVALSIVFGCINKDKQDNEKAKNEVTNVTKSVSDSEKPAAKGYTNEYIYSVIKALQTNDKEKFINALLMNANTILPQAGFQDCDDKLKAERTKCIEDNIKINREKVDPYNNFATYSYYFPQSSKYEVINVNQEGIYYIKVVYAENDAPTIMFKDKNLKIKEGIVATIRCDQQTGILDYRLSPRLFEVTEVLSSY